MLTVALLLSFLFTLCAAPLEAETIAVEAEVLALPAVADHLQSDWRASNRMVFVGRDKGLAWSVKVKGSIYHVWLLGRSGWSPEHRYYADGAYYVQVGDQKWPLTAVRETLHYSSPESNYVWFRSEPIELAAGEHDLQLGCTWTWGKFDGVVLTDDPFTPPGVGPEALAQLRQVLPFPQTLWTADPYAPFRVDVAEPEQQQKPTIDLLSPRNASAYGALVIRQPESATRPAHLRLRMTPLKAESGATIAPQHVSLHQLVTLSAGFGGPGLLASDALPPLGPLGYVEVAGGFASCIWMIVRVPSDQTPGVYTGSIVLEEQHTMSRAHVPVQVDVKDVTLSERSDLAVYTWWRHLGASDAQWAQIVERGINTFGFIIDTALDYRFNEDGALLGEVRFRPELERIVRAQRASGGFVMIEWYFQPGAPIARAIGAEEEFEYMTPPWKRAFATLARAIHEHLENKGVEREKLLHYIFDETIGEHFVETAKFIRSLDPSYKIFSNGNGDLASYKKVAPYVDIWCAHVHNVHAMSTDGRLDFLRTTGKPVWSYDEGYHQRAKPPYTTYRRRFWRALQYGLQGVGNWKHHGLVGMTYQPSYGTRVTSRRYEAWCSGIEDHKMLTMLRSVANSASEGSVAAKALLYEAIGETSRSGDTRTADRYRHQILRLLARPQE